MKNAPSLVFAAFLTVTAANVHPAAAQALSVTEAQKAKLVALVAKDNEAKAAFAPLLKQADDALVDTPDPIAAIVSEGTLASDPRKVRTGQSLRDMKKVESLAWAAAVTGKKEYMDKTCAFLLAWAKTNTATGNPINETKLEPLFIAYDLAGGGFSPSDRKTVEAYFRSIALAEQRSAEKGTATQMNNWHSHRIKTIGLIGFALHDPALIKWADDAFHKQIEINLLADGASWDFNERDALHYHLYDLEPLLTIAQAARQSSGADWFHYQSPKGASLAKSVAWTVPYATGEKTHGEFVHSKVAFDKKRAQAGEKGYAPGTLFEPRAARTVFEKALVWEPDKYHSLALLLLTPEGKAPAKRFGSWQMVVQEARR